MSRKCGNKQLIFIKPVFIAGSARTPGFASFSIISRNPYDPSTCLALYGGPVDPAIALGGFLEPGRPLSDKPPYENATAIIITFLVNNYHNKTKLEPALNWEAK